MIIHLEIERLILRDLIATDVDGLFELDSNPNVYIYLENNPAENIDPIRELTKQYKNNIERMELDVEPLLTTKQTFLLDGQD